MPKIITARVFRYDPDQDAQPRYQDYHVPVEEEISVLVLLNRIQREKDPTLSFRSFCCGLQMCGSCLIKIDRKKRLACLTLVKPGETVTLEPTSYPDRHIKDLVTQITQKERKRR